MELCGRNILDACFHGCPEINFSALAEAIAAHEGDVEKVKKAGVGAEALAAVVALGAPLEQRAIDLAKKIPAGSTGPWRIEGSDLSTRAREVAGTIECCQFAGVVLIDLKGGEDAHVRRGAQ